MGKLLQEDLRIPAYQRPYSWDPTTALQLLDDVADASESGSGSYVLGAVILHRDVETGQLDVVDGQQRLLTLLLIKQLLGGEMDEDPSSHAEQASAIVLARRALSRRLKTRCPGVTDRNALADYIDANCHLIRVETSDPDEAFRVFDSQNYRGKSLLPHDLLKAFHLREMRGESESMQSAIVEGWQSVSDDELDRLFSVYLWRIHRWSRGLPAPAFTPQHIDVFKGVTTRQAANVPSAQYHLVAQSALPIVTAIAGTGVGDPRDFNRSRFQLDAPIQAGRTFFEMVAFMLREIRALRDEAYEAEGWEEFASSSRDDRVGGSGFVERSTMNRYRYTAELYLASLLYFTNRFGHSEKEDSRRLLFTWAYALRTQLLRVQFASVNNHAIGGGEGSSAFVLIRNARDAADLRALRVDVKRRNNEHEAELAALLEELVS